MNNIKEIIEAIIFSSGKSISKKYILQKLSDLTNIELDAAINELKDKYSGDCGILLITVGDNVQFCSNIKYGELVSDVLLETREKELSRTLLETLAIIAYKKEATRSEIEDVRGLTSDYSITRLCQLDLIKVIGRRNTFGRPYVFATTEQFLKKFELDSLDELPDLERLQERIKLIGENYNSKTESLFNTRVIEEDGTIKSISAEAKDLNVAYQNIVSTKAEDTEYYDVDDFDFKS